MPAFALSLSWRRRNPTGRLAMINRYNSPRKGLDLLAFRLDGQLRSLRAHWHVLRALCDGDWIGVDNTRNQRRLRACIRILVKTHPHPRPPDSILRCAANEPADSTYQCLAGCAQTSEGRNYDTPEHDWIGRLWEGKRNLFENEVVPVIPRPIRDRLRLEEDMLRYCWRLPFRLRDSTNLANCKDWIQAGITVAGVISCTQWWQLKALLSDEKFEPMWRNLPRTIELVNRVRYQFRSEGRDDPNPTDMEIQNELLQTVRTHEPTAIHYENREDLLTRIAHCDIFLSPVLDCAILGDRVIERLRPGYVTRQQIEYNINELVQNSNLERVILHDSVMYFTSFGRKLPEWDEGLREFRFRGHSKTYRDDAEWQTTILQCFQEIGWASRIDDPLPGIAMKSQERKESARIDRLRNTVKNLNKSVKGWGIRFGLDGTKTGIFWEVVQVAVATA